MTKTPSHAWGKCSHIPGSFTTFSAGCLAYTKTDVLMISKKSVVPNNPEGFKNDLSKVTGLSWYIYTNTPLLNMSAFFSNLKMKLRSKLR